MKRGLKEVKRFTRGNTYMASGIVKSRKSIKCPSCDTVYLQLHRDGDNTTTLCITPEEAVLIRRLLAAAKGAL